MQVDWKILCKVIWKSFICSSRVNLLHWRGVIDWPTLPLIDGTSWSESAGRSFNYHQRCPNMSQSAFQTPHTSVVGSFRNANSRIHGQKLSKPFGANIFRAWEPSKGVETLCETENVSTRTIPCWALFAKSPITLPITGWQGLGGGIQNNWRPLGRLLCTMRPYILEFGSI